MLLFPKLSIIITIKMLFLVVDSGFLKLPVDVPRIHMSSPSPVYVYVSVCKRQIRHIYNFISPQTAVSPGERHSQSSIRANLGRVVGVVGGREVGVLHHAPLPLH